MRGAIVVLMLVLGGCMMDTREPVPGEPECVDLSPDCGSESGGPWCVEGRTLLEGAPSCDDGVTVVCAGGGEPTCDPDGFDL